MNTRPKINTKKYYEYVDRAVKIIEEKLPFTIYGFTNYVMAGYWKLQDGSQFQEPSHIPLDVFETILNVKFE